MSIIKRFFCLIIILVFVTQSVWSASACDGAVLGHILLEPDFTALTVTIYPSSASTTNNAGYNVASATTSGVTSWNYSGSTYLNVTFSSVSYSTSHHTIYILVGDYGPGYQGGCMVYNTSGLRLNPADATGLYPNSTSDWSYAIIRIHTDNTGIAGAPYDGLKAVGAHEAGHALGLAHCTIKSHEQVMFNPPLDVYYVYDISTPSSTERGTLTALYSTHI